MPGRCRLSQAAEKNFIDHKAKCVKLLDVYEEKLAYGKAYLSVRTRQLKAAAKQPGQASLLSYAAVQPSEEAQPPVTCNEVFCGGGWSFPQPLPPTLREHNSIAPGYCM